MTDLSADFKALANYCPTHKVRFVTAASLFDGHDAAINIMRRILQGMGAEVIHLGHNRSVDEVVTAALQEDVQGIAISSYQGGHVEYFKYMVDLLRQRGGALAVQRWGHGAAQSCSGPASSPAPSPRGRLRCPPSQRFTAGLSISNRSSARPTVWSTMSCTVAGRW